VEITVKKLSRGERPSTFTVRGDSERGENKGLPHDARSKAGERENWGEKKRGRAAREKACPLKGS